MTVLGADFSNYNTSTPFGGLGFVTHKATEGTKIKHDKYDDRLNAARDAGVPVLGSYHVVRTPGNGGNGTLAEQLAYWVAYLDSQTPWWRTYPNWVHQIDAEKWEYDAVSATTVKQFAALVSSARLPGYVVTYASRGQYADSLAGIATDLWNADYRGGQSYPGDGWTRTANGSPAGWATFSGKTPRFLQYTSTPYDKDAFRGSLADLLALTRSTAAPAVLVPTKEDDVTTVFVSERETGKMWASTGASRFWVKNGAAGDAVLKAFGHIDSKGNADWSVQKSVTSQELRDGFGVDVDAAERVDLLDADVTAIVDGLVAKLPPTSITRDQVEQAVRDAFARGLAPDAA